MRFTLQSLIPPTLMTVVIACGNMWGTSIWYSTLWTQIFLKSLNQISTWERVISNI